MHNKAFIVDNTVAVVRGPNIGDHYFSVDGNANFRDADLFAADDLLRCGVELHELGADAAFVRHDWTWLHGRSETELHTKAALFDDKEAMIGSFNMV